jgi:hypothetical protein
MFEPLAAQHAAGAVLVLAALGALVLAWLSLRAAPRAFAVVAALLVLSLAARALFVAYFAAVALAAWAARARLGRDAVVVACGTGFAIGARLIAAASAHSPAEAPRDPRASVEYWRARDNMWRARSAALAWARAEKDAPGEGYSVLAQLDWDLGERDKARRVLKHLIEGTHDPAVGEQAERLLLDWGDR